MTSKQKKELDAKRKALWNALRNISSPNAQSLSKSYGLPVSDVERTIRSQQNAS